MSETNPFRLSMLRRSESPSEDAYTGLLPAPTHLAQAHSGPTTPTGYPLNNPFFQDVAPPRTRVSSQPETLQDLVTYGESTPASEGVMPPSYQEVSHGRSRSSSREKDRARDDPTYREGYEEGMRMARERERQRRRQLRSREARRDAAARGEPAADRPERGERPERTQRSDKEPRTHRTHRHRSKSDTTGTRRVKNPSLDVIDKLDVTGFYAPSGFHHDGPFDACAPHRNRTTKRNTATPVAAFQVNGPNNSLAFEDRSVQAYRREEEVYGRPTTRVPETMPSFDPTERGPKVYGDRTAGLGSSTFIDGTQASLEAQREENRTASVGRSKSLLRRPSTRRSPVPDRYQDSDDDEDMPPRGLLGRVRSLRVGRH